MTPPRAAGRRSRLRRRRHVSGPDRGRSSLCRVYNITSFLLHIRQRAADMAVVPAPGAATPADTAPRAATAPPVTDMDRGTGASAVVDGTAQSDAIPASTDISTAADEARDPTASGGRRRKRKYAPGRTGRRHQRWCSDNAVRAPDSGDAQAGGGGESGV